MLRSLLDPGLKLSFLRDYLTRDDIQTAANALDVLCAAAARADESVREPVLALAMFLAGLGDDPLANRLGEACASGGLTSLGRLLRRMPELAPEERALRVPDYGRGRDLTLGERKALARKPSRALFEKLLRDPHPLVIRQLLENPLLTEMDVVRLAAVRPHPSVDALRALARTPWLCRPRVRMALIQNPATPAEVAVPLIAACTRPELMDVRHSPDCSLAVRRTAEELWELRRESLQPSSSPSSSQRSSAPSVTLEAQRSQRGGSS